VIFTEIALKSVIINPVKNTEIDSFLINKAVVDAKKAIDSAIRTTSAGLKSDRDKVAMRFKMQEAKKKKAAQDKIKFY
jgi:hypothetical protein